MFFTPLNFSCCDKYICLPLEPTIYYNSEYGDGQLPIVYSNIHCQGTEDSISDCDKTDYLDFSCSQAAGVLCEDSEL